MKRIILTKSAMCRFKQGDFVSFLALLIEATTSMENENNKILIDDLKLKRAELLSAIANYSTKDLSKQIHDCCVLMRTCRAGIRYAYKFILLGKDESLSEIALRVKDINDKYPTRNIYSNYSLLSCIENLNKELKSLGEKSLMQVGIKQFVDDLDTYVAQLIKLYDDRTIERLRIKSLKDEKKSNAIKSVCDFIKYIEIYNYVEGGKYDELIDKINDIYQQSKSLFYNRVSEDKTEEEVVEIDNQD